MVEAFTTLSYDESYSKSQDSENEVLYISINQEQNLIALGTSIGFKIFSISPLQLFYESRCGPIKIVELLYSTNLLLLVGKNEIGDFSPRKATIFKTNDNSVICSTWPFSSQIQLAKLNKKRILLLESNTIHIYNTSDISALHTIDLGSVYSCNPINSIINRICLSPSSEKNNFLIYSISDTEGIIKIYDWLYLTYKTTIQAHKTPIEQMNVNSTGELWVTTSVKGMYVRVFTIPKGDKIYTVKRGITNANIYSICFDMELNNKIVLSSETGTIHIISLEDNRQEIDGNSNNNKDCKGSMIMELVNKVTEKIISKEYEDVINYQRSLISGNFQEIKNKNIILFKGGSKSEEVLAINDKGVCYSFNVNYKTLTIKKGLVVDLQGLHIIV